MRNEFTRDLLIVDDDEPLRTLICEAMTRRGLDCDIARDGLEALELMRTTTFAVVLLDLMMPKADATEFLKQLAALKLTKKNHPIVFLMTAREPEEIPTFGDEVQAVIRKPFMLSEVVALVSGTIERRRAGAAR
jgi:DNA-binding response OmpR family regulator